MTSCQCTIGSFDYSEVDFCCFLNGIPKQGFFFLAVIENGFCKKLCIKMFPEISCFTRVIEISDSLEPIKAGTSNSVNWEYLEMDHKVYAHLARSLMSARTSNDCIETSIHASSTDNDAFESIENTLDPRERVMGAPSYWSSIGEKDPEMSETLTYKLKSKLCVIDEIHIRPFRGNLILPH